jgi:outer membrane protein assembly factor BamB
MTAVRSLVVTVWVACVAATAAWAASDPPAKGAAAPPSAKGDVLPLAPAAAADKGLEVLWRTEVVPEPGTSLSRLWVCGKTVVACGTDNRIYAVSAATGIRLWSFQAAEVFQTVWPPAADKDNLWVATTTQLIGLEGAGGRVVATFRLPFAPAGRPATNGVHVFIPDTRGWLQAVNVLPRVVSWGRWTEDSVTAGPVLDSNLVYFASQSGVVYASMQNTRNVTWEHRTEGAVVADLARTETGLILAASLDYSLYAFQGPSGRIVWRYNAGEPIRKTPHTAGNQVFVFTKEAGLTALDAANGRVQWRLAEGADFVSADPKVVYVLSRTGDLVGTNRPDGKVRFTLSPEKGTLAAVNDGASGVVYLALPGGQVMAIARKGLAEEAKKTEQPQETTEEPKTPVPPGPAPGIPAVPAPAAPAPAAPAAPAPAAPAAPAPVAPAEPAPAAPAAPAPVAPAEPAPAAPAGPAPAAPAAPAEAAPAAPAEAAPAGPAAPAAPEAE